MFCVAMGEHARMVRKRLLLFIVYGVLTFFYPLPLYMCGLLFVNEAHSSVVLDVHVASAHAREGRLALSLYVGSHSEDRSEDGGGERNDPPNANRVYSALDAAECAWPLPASLRTNNIDDSRTDLHVAASAAGVRTGRFVRVETTCDVPHDIWGGSEVVRVHILSRKGLRLTLELCRDE